MVDLLFVSTEQPVRTCVACRVRRSQGSLLRVVRKPDATVDIDLAKKRSPGRGAYLCFAISCIEHAKVRRILPRALRCEIKDEVYIQLTQLLANPPSEEM